MATDQQLIEGMRLRAQLKVEGWNQCTDEEYAAVERNDRAYVEEVDANIRSCAEAIISIRNCLPDPRGLGGSNLALDKLIEYIVNSDAHAASYMAYKINEIAPEAMNRQMNAKYIAEGHPEWCS
jgi:hypothetical protein